MSATQNGVLADIAATNGRRLASDAVVDPSRSVPNKVGLGPHRRLSVNLEKGPRPFVYVPGSKPEEPEDEEALLHLKITQSKLSSRVVLTNESGIEDNVRAAVSARDRVNALSVQWEEQRREEDEANVQAMLSQGHINQEQAHRLNARRKMRRYSQESVDSFQVALTANEYVSTEHMLEEALDADYSNRLLRLLKRALGIHAIQRAVAHERQRRTRADFRHPCPPLAILVQSAFFESAIGVLMSVNAVLIGVQASVDEEPLLLDILEHVFTGIFVVEVSLKLAVFGWVWVCDTWNILDVCLIVFTGVLPMWVLKPLGIEGQGTRVVQTLRSFRLIRLVRMFRTKWFLRMPYKLTQGLMDSSRTIFHTYVVIGTTMFIFSVFGVYFIGRARAFQADQTVQVLAQDSFYTVPQSIFTLFQVMTLDSWTGVARPLMKHTLGALFFFVLAIMVNTLVLQNLITAVIVNNALKLMAEDDEMAAVERRDAMEAELRDLREIFISLDTDCSGFLSQEEFLSAVKDNIRVRNKLEILQVHVNEAGEVWDLIDEGDQRGVNIDRFAECMRAMGGDAKAKDSFSIVQRIKHVNCRISRLKMQLMDCKKQAEDLQGAAKHVKEAFAVALQEAKQLVFFMGDCIPQTPAPREESQLTATGILRLRSHRALHPEA